MSRLMSDLSPETYVLNPGTSSGISRFAGRLLFCRGFGQPGREARDRYEPPETASWLTKQSNVRSRRSVVLSVQPRSGDETVTQTGGNTKLPPEKHPSRCPAGDADQQSRRKRQNACRRVGVATGL